ncbi:MAG: transposase, partial [Dysgonomonas sp.]
MAKNQNKYTPEFKQQLVDLYNTGNYSFPQLSSEYGVAKSTILGWVKTLTPVQVSGTDTISMK